MSSKLPHSVSVLQWLAGALLHGHNSQQQSNVPSKANKFTSRVKAQRFIDVSLQPPPTEALEYPCTVPQQTPAGRMVAFRCTKHSPCTLTWPTHKDDKGAHARLQAPLALGQLSAISLQRLWLQHGLTVIRTPCQPKRRAPRTPCQEAASRPQTVRESVRSRCSTLPFLPKQRLFWSRTLSPPCQDMSGLLSTLHRERSAGSSSQNSIWVRAALYTMTQYGE